MCTNKSALIEVKWQKAPRFSSGFAAQDEILSRKPDFAK